MDTFQLLMSLLWKIFTLQCQKTLLTFRSLIITRASSLDKYSHSQCGKSRNSLTPKKYLGIQLFRENVAFTIFVSKKCEIVISIFSTLWYLFKHNLPYLVVVKVTLITKYIHKRCFTSAFFFLLSQKKVQKVTSTFSTKSIPQCGKWNLKKFTLTISMQKLSESNIVNIFNSQNIFQVRVSRFFIFHTVILVYYVSNVISWLWKRSKWGFYFIPFPKYFGSTTIWKSIRKIKCPRLLGYHFMNLSVWKLTTLEE